MTMLSNYEFSFLFVLFILICVHCEKQVNSTIFLIKTISQIYFSFLKVVYFILKKAIKEKLYVLITP